MDDLENVFERQRLEVKAVRRVVVGRNGLRIAVDHDRFIAVLAERHRGVHAAVIELDPLPDPVRTPAQHDHLLPARRRGFALFLVGRIHVRGLGGEFRGAGVDPFVNGADAECVTSGAHFRLLRLQQEGKAAVREAHSLETAELLARQSRQAALLELQLGVDDFLDLRQKPRIDLRVLENLFQRHPDAERIGDVPQSLRAGISELVADLLRVDCLQVEAVDAGFQPAERFLQRFLKRAADRHHLADRFHLRGQPIVGLLEFLECEPRYLDHDVIDRRLERGRGQPAGDVVGELVQRVTHRKLGGNLGDRKAGRLRRERRGARHARIHLDDDHPAVVGVDRELDVRAAGVDADLAQHRDRGVAHDLVFLVGQRLRRRDGDRIAGVHTHRIDVLDRADDDAVVLLVADNFHLELLPAEQRFLDQQLVRRRSGEAALAHLDELVLVVRDAAAGTAQRERGPDHRRETDLRLHLERLLEVVRDARARGAEADARHRRLEFLAVLRLVDRFLGGADQLDIELVQHALAREVERAVQRRLATHRRQQRVRPLALDDLRDHRPGDRLDVRDVRHLRIRHDRGGIAVHEDDAIAFLAQRLARLRTGIVELARLPNDDRAGADDQDRLNVRALRHCRKAAVQARDALRSAS